VSNADDIESQAAEWLVWRDAAPTEWNRDFTAWLAADPRHRAAYLRLAAAWERTAHLRRLRPEGSSLDADLLSGKPPARSGFGRWRPFAAAVGLALVALLGAWWLLNNRDVEIYRTDIGGLSRVLLADGSTVTLNTDTEVHVRLSAKRRQITLVRGEAQFAVAHDVSRPFDVSASGHILRAVGTAFDVRIDPNQALQVIVTEGRVALEDVPAVGGATRKRRVSETVSAGESATADNGKVAVRPVSTTEASRRLAWETGELSFQGETLREAVAEFNRYNRRKLKVEDPALAELQVGGNFRALDVDSFVAALERSFNVTAKSSEDGTVKLERTADYHRN
jgi:transmembrane sensor